jgi:hypothetical protein
MTHEDAVDKDRGAIGINVQLYFSGDAWKLNPRIFSHSHFDGLGLPGSDRDVLNKVDIAALANRDFVLAWEQQKFLRSFEFVQVADVLAVDPDTRGALDFSGADEVNLAQHIVPSMYGGDENHIAKENKSANDTASF